MLVAAYAFALNTLLATALVSSIALPPWAQSDVTCTADASPSHDNDIDHSAHDPAHCAVHCLAHQRAALLPTAPVAFGRIVMIELRQAAIEVSIIAPSRPAQFDPRAPPRTA